MSTDRSSREDGAFRLFHLRETGYERVSRSELPQLETLDIALLTQCVLMGQTSCLDAARAFQQGIRRASFP